MSAKGLYPNPATGVAAPAIATHEVAKTANYTVKAGDNGTLFTTKGASGEVDFTLPAIAVGHCFEFLNLADQIMKVISAEGTNIVWDNATTLKSSLAAQTTSHQLGAYLRVFSSQDGTTWYVRNYSPASITITAA